MVRLAFVVNGLTAVDYDPITIDVRQSNINMGNGAVKGVSRWFKRIDNIVRFGLVMFITISLLYSSLCWGYLLVVSSLFIIIQ